MVQGILRAIRMTTKPKVVFVLGGPGAGKGTACYRIVQEYGFVHLSAGDLLREERSNPGSEFGELIETHIKNGSIVPVQITCSLIERAMKRSGQEKFLIDGFPRNKDNVDGWQSAMGNNVNLLFVLFIECPLEICTNRCLSRGAAGSGRSDDNMESLRKRINTYLSESRPIIEYYQTLNLVRQVDGSKTPDEVFDNIKKIFADVKAMGDL